jgi:hypothetical protein
MGFASEGGSIKKLAGAIKDRRLRLAYVWVFWPRRTVMFKAMRVATYVMFWMVMVDTFCLQVSGWDAWRAAKAAVFLGPVLAAISFVLAVKPVWIVNNKN